jgi:putative NADH-flavin reductase
MKSSAMPETGVRLKLAVIGASGRTGREIVEQALARGHKVTATVRRANAPAPRAGLTVVEGDVFDHRFLASVLDGHAVVVSALARGNQQAAVLTDAAAATVKALHSCRAAPRYLVVSQALLFASSNPLIHILRRILRAAVADSVAMERLVATSGLEWTIVRPPRLTEGKAKSSYAVKANARPQGGSAMTRADLATFLVDEAEHGAFRNTVVGVA